ncbi:MAG: matrixin family metalloprotease [Candidatus Pacearchaeota archaeon]|jgi:hypothetical protein
MRYLITLAFILALVSLGISSFMLYNFYLRNPENISIFSIPIKPNVMNSTFSIKDYPQGLVLYENIRFPDKTITFSIDSNCNNGKTTDAINAFRLIQNSTILKFTEIKDNGQIMISCSDDKKQTSEDYYIAGEGAPVIINTTKYSIILNGTVMLYEENKCSKPIVAIHEILHILGFIHSSNKNSIMYNLSNCNQQVDPVIITKINSLYSDPSLPDLVIEKVNATKKDRYLSFEISVINEGLKNSSKTNITIYEETNQIAEYSLESLESGSGKILKVQNLRISPTSENFTFVVNENNQFDEIDHQNNRVTLTLK